MSDGALNSIAAKSIPNGTKFVAIYNDGSGARLFLIDDLGDLYDAEDIAIGQGPDTYLLDSGFSHWLKLPNNFKLWFEQKEEERP